MEGGVPPYRVGKRQINLWLKPELLGAFRFMAQHEGMKYGPFMERLIRREADRMGLKQFGTPADWPIEMRDEN